MEKIKNFLLITLTTILYGCLNSLEISENDVPKNINEFAKAYIENIHEGNIDSCLIHSVTEMNTEEGREFLTNTYNNIKFFDVKSIKIVGYRITTLFGSKGFTNYFIDYEYNYGKFVYYSVSVQDKDNKLAIIGFNGQMFEKSLSELNKFTFSGKGILHYLFLFFMLIIPVFIAITIIFMVKTPMKRKWLWIIGALFGFMSFNLNWTTGDFGFQIITFKLLGIGFVKSGTVAPWIASFSIPLFSIIFWFKRKSFFTQAEIDKRYLESMRRDEELKAKANIND